MASVTDEPIGKTIDLIEEEDRNSTPEANVDRWMNFFDSFQITKTKTITGGKQETIKSRPYLTQIKNMAAAKPHIYATSNEEQSNDSVGRQIFVLDYQDLVHARSDMFNIFTSEKTKKKEDKERRILNMKVLCYQIKNHWDTAKVAIKHAVYRLLQTHDKSYADTLIDADKIIVVVHDFEITKPIIDVSSKDLDKFMRLEVLIAQFDDQPSIELLGIGYKCIACSQVIALPANRKAPNKCINCERTGTYVEEPSMKKVRDFMYFVGQDLTEKMRIGQTVPNSINVSIAEMPFVKSVYNMMEVGSYVALNGIVRLAEGSKASIRSNAEFECVGIEILSEKNQYDKDIRALVERDIEPEQMDDHYEKLKKSYAPHLQGLEIPKETLLLHAASGGSLKDRTGGTRIRGRMNTLLLGDAAQGKSELLNFHVRLHKRSVPVLGSLSSRVGITASIKKIETVRGGEKITRQSIDPGPYGICRKGDVCIDEWDKVANKDIYESVAGAMDNFQSLHLHKNAAHTTIMVDCGSLHAANPTSGSGKYDVSMSVFKQTDFATWLWSRYDFKILFTSHRTDESRHMLWAHKAKTYENMITENEFNNVSYDQYIRNKTKNNIDILEGEIYPFDYLVHELAYIIEKYPDPVFKPNSMAWIMMTQFWNKFNQISIIPDSDMLADGEKSLFYPALDERAQDSMIRAAKASARLHRRNEVTTEDMNIVMKLMRQTIKAFIPHVDFDTEAEREENLAKRILNETIKAAMLFNTKELNAKIVKFYYAYIKVLKQIHHDYFIKCPTCHGRGFINEKYGYTQDSADKEAPCNACHNTKGYYNKMSYAEFEKICIDCGCSIYANDFFGLTKTVGILYKDKHAITTTIYYKVPPDITNIVSPTVLAKVQRAINTQFGLDETAISQQKELLLKTTQ